MLWKRALGLGFLSVVGSAEDTNRPRGQVTLLNLSLLPPLTKALTWKEKYDMF